jgi:ribosomal protein S18 acetylase RimI-like enzyme
MVKQHPLRLLAATPEDDAFCIALYASTRAEELEAWGWDGAQQRAFLALQYQAQTQSYQTQYPQRNRSIIYLDQQPIGGIQINHTPTHIHLIDLALLPPYRRRGIGTQILRELCEKAQGKSVQLQVLAQSPAMALYQRLGFQTVADTGLYQQMEWQAKLLERISP